MKTLKLISSIFTLAVFTLAACNNPDNNQSQTTTLDTLANNNKAGNDTAASGDPFTPFDSSFSARVLTVGNFHHDEVEENAARLKWFGLFKNNEGYYLKHTEIITVKIHDPVLDDENEKTGWRVKTINKDRCIILIEPLPFLADRTVQSVKLSKEHIYPGETLTFTYSGNDYEIFATGDKNQSTQHQEWNNISNYKLYLQAVIKGQTRKSLLVTIPNFDDQKITLIFAGDIDGDGILDLIIDTSRHYNVTSPTLYLSRPADMKAVVKPVGGHTSVGG